MKCIIVSSRQDSPAVPLWAHEAIIVCPSDSPKTQIWVTIVLHIESANGAYDDAHGDFSLIHPGLITMPMDRSESLLGMEDKWLNESINKTEGRAIRVRDDGKSLTLAHDIKSPLPFTMWGELEYALEPVYPLPIGTSDGARLSIWPDSELLKKIKKKGSTPPFTEMQVSVPRKKGRELRICRLSFEVTPGMVPAGIPDQYVLMAYGPNEMVREIRRDLCELPMELEELFMRRYREATKAFRPIQYDVTVFGSPAGHTYIVEWGDEHRPTPMFTVEEPGMPDRTRQVFSFTPTDLNFRLQILVIPANIRR